MLYLVLIFLTFYFVAADAWYVTLSNNGPIVSGASITFTANVYREQSDIFSPGTLIFYWRDNAIPKHSYEFSGETTNSTWTVSYPKNPYVPGIYEVDISVYRHFFIDYPICSNRQFFNVTMFLNGNLEVKQNNSTLNKYVSTGSPVIHEITFNKPNTEFLRKNASYIYSYWFVDNTFYGSVPNLTFKFNYTKPGKVYSIEAIVIASHDPFDSIAFNQNTTNPWITTSPSIKNSSITNKSLFSENGIRFAHVLTNPTKSYYSDNGFASNEIEYFNDSKSLYSISNNSNIVTDDYNKTQTNVPLPGYLQLPILDPNKTYGHFSRNVIPKDPISDILIEGNVWLQHGQLLNLNVSCNGTGPFSYCKNFVEGVYNITGNETCSLWFSEAKCDIPVKRYLKDSITYTLILMIQNDVSKTITPVGINVYDVTKQPQLSVIIVPVSASIVAVILVIFGIAYYIQSKRRYTVEVADFDFSHTSDLEYKSLYERVLDSINNACNKEEVYSEQDSISVCPASRTTDNVNK